MDRYGKTRRKIGENPAVLKVKVLTTSTGEYQDEINEGRSRDEKQETQPSCSNEREMFYEEKKTILDLETDGYCTYSVLN